MRREASPIDTLPGVFLPTAPPISLLHIVILIICCAVHRVPVDSRLQVVVRLGVQVACRQILRFKVGRRSGAQGFGGRPDPGSGVLEWQGARA